MLLIVALEALSSKFFYGKQLHSIANRKISSNSLKEMSWDISHPHSNVTSKRKDYTNIMDAIHKS